MMAAAGASEADTPTLQRRICVDTLPSAGDKVIQQDKNERTDPLRIGREGPCAARSGRRKKIHMYANGDAQRHLVEELVDDLLTLQSAKRSFTLIVRNAGVPRS